MEKSVVVFVLNASVEIQSSLNKREATLVRKALFSQELFRVVS